MIIVLCLVRVSHLHENTVISDQRFHDLSSVRITKSFSLVTQFILNLWPKRRICPMLDSDTQTALWKSFHVQHLHVFFVFFFHFLNLVTFIYCEISFVFILKWPALLLFFIHDTSRKWKLRRWNLTFWLWLRLITSADGLINWAWTRCVHCNQTPFLFTAFCFPSECREGKSDNQEIRKSGCWWC